MGKDFSPAVNTHSASAIASTEKEEASIAHVHNEAFRTRRVCPSNCLTISLTSPSNDKLKHIQMFSVFVKIACQNLYISRFAADLASIELQ